MSLSYGVSYRQRVVQRLSVCTRLVVRSGEEEEDGGVGSHP